MVAHWPIQHLQIMPVGWGFLSLHNTINHNESVAIITDGGTLLPCYRKVVSSPLIHDVIRIFRSSNGLVWIISHFDYDHISLTAQLLNHTNTYADLCIIPFTYSVEACRDALALYLAFMASVIKPPKLPEALEAVLNRCRIKVLVERGSSIFYDNYSQYEFLWPDAHYISSTNICDKIQKELRKRIENSCKRNPEMCKDLEKNIGYIREKLGSMSGDAKLIKELNIRNYLHGIEELRVDQLEEFIIRKLTHERTRKETGDIEEPFLKVLETYKLRCFKERLENMYSLAYIIRPLRPDPGIIEIIRPYNQHIRCKVFHEYYLSWPDENIMMYLGDLDDSSIGLAIDGYVPTRVSVLVPAHHGNRWHTKLSQVRAYTTYLNRCDEHPQGSYRRLRQGYLKYPGRVIMGGHDYYLSHKF